MFQVFQVVGVGRYSRNDNYKNANHGHEHNDYRSTMGGAVIFNAVATDKDKKPQKLSKCNKKGNSRPEEQEVYCADDIIA